MLVLSIITLFLFILLETTVTTIPLLLVVILIMAVVSKKSWIFLIAFILGILADSLLFNMMGKTSLFFVIFLFIILSYDRKFEIRTVYFVLISSFLGSLFYLIFYGYNSIFMQSFLSSIIAAILFLAVKRILKFDAKSKLAI